MNGDPRDYKWAAFTHLAAFAGYVIPLGNIIGPLVFWIFKKDESALVDDQGKEAMNFQITIVIYALVAGVSMLFFVGFLLLPVVLLFNIVMIIIAAVKASGGEAFRYPLCIRFIN
jgi:hypothetical protein